METSCKALRRSVRINFNLLNSRSASTIKSHDRNYRYLWKRHSVASIKTQKFIFFLNFVKKKKNCQKNLKIAKKRQIATAFKKCFRDNKNRQKNTKSPQVEALEIAKWQSIGGIHCNRSVWTYIYTLLMKINANCMDFTSTKGDSPVSWFLTFGATFGHRDWIKFLAV